MTWIHSKLYGHSLLFLVIVSFLSLHLAPGLVWPGQLRRGIRATISPLAYSAGNPPVVRFLFPFRPPIGLYMVLPWPFSFIFFPFIYLYGRFLLFYSWYI